MAEYKDAIPAALGKLEYLHQPDGRLAFKISGHMRAMYMVATGGAFSLADKTSPRGLR
jgi:hypothetical protein